MKISTITIGDLARRSATKVQTIRFYEQQGLMPAPARTDGGQRRYEEAHAKRLAFIRHARELGFPLDAVRELLRLSDQPNESCENVDRVAHQVLAEVNAKIDRLVLLQSELRRMIKQGKHGKIGDCRIIAVLADHSHSQCESSDHANVSRNEVDQSRDKSRNAKPKQQRDKAALLAAVGARSGKPR